MTTTISKLGSVLGGKYSVVRQLGEGGMGAVFEAENVVTRKRVAVKWLHPHVAAADGQGAVTRLVREAQAASLVRHPNVVDVFDVVVEGETVFLVMELLHGESLSSYLLRADASIPESTALLLNAMRGVEFAHSRGVIHRDIKPDNIFLACVPDTPRPVAKVLDFGISKIVGRAQTTLTATGTRLGTPLYMSYEQLSCAKNVDHRTDIYAFGVILYEIATGRSPFNADSFPELVFKIATTEPPSPKSLRPELPLQLDRVIMWALAKRPEARPQTMKQLIGELEVFGTAAPFRAETLATGPVRKRRSRPLGSVDHRVPFSALSGVTRGSSATTAPGGRRTLFAQLLVSIGLGLVLLVVVWWIRREPSAAQLTLPAPLAVGPVTTTPDLELVPVQTRVTAETDEPERGFGDLDVAATQVRPATKLKAAKPKKAVSQELGF